MSDSQLYTYARKDFEAFFHMAQDGTPQTRSAGGVPLVFWPDGRWCIEVNLYLQRCYEAGASHFGDKGGTLGTYAAYLTHLVRRCFDSGLTDFSQLRQSHFKSFVVGLNADKVWKNGRQVSKRNSETQEKTVCVWLDFLDFVGEFYAIPDFVSKSGRIRAYKKPYKRKVGRNKTAVGMKWWWERRPLRRRVTRRRLPITDAQFGTLKQTADALTTNPFIRRRRLAMFVLFDSVGLRRAEMAIFTAQCVRNALRELEAADQRGDKDFIPMLRFNTVKGENGDRECPISRVNLRYLESYMLKFRLPLVAKKNAGEVLSGPFFVNSKNGKELTHNHFTREFYLIRKLCGMAEKASPHMMRHRFITKLFVRLILAHNLETEDELRRLLLSTEAIKEHVREITGHASVESLEVYIHLAIDEVTEFKKTLKRITDLSGLELLSDARNRFASAVASQKDLHDSSVELAATVDEILRGYGKDIDYKNSEEWTKFLETTGKARGRTGAIACPR
ncbi:tyrosine-type recombinase/integrase [Burkholderia lata]|uniref:tyrosine-type recombinase/integrase n=1 Tax=Burkholderia lata (strain ATCC 17760 / DSM 23089 / LMG 22485 / NCIMB 9086 / R18194 / 383) TaxID=482957 RepID=UPI001453C5B5|nr:site-specific integrase [Burkholderia lata]VWB31471.1 Tyrosine recombinase XerC [Burkholderia lata]